MVPIGIDCGDQRPKGRAALAGNLLQTVPELVFKADARLVACNDNRALGNQRLHGFSPANEPSVLPGKKHGLATVPEIMRQAPSILSIIRKLIPCGMPQHMRV